MNDESNRRMKSLVAAGVLVASLAAIPVAASAQSDAPAKDQTAQLIPNGDEGGPIENDAVELDADMGDAEIGDDDFLEGEEFEAEEIDIEDLDDETLAEIQALEDELAAALDEAGVAYEWVEEDGLRFVEIDWDDEAAVEAFETVLEEVFDDVEFDVEFGEMDLDDAFEGDFENFEWTEADLAEFDAEQSELAAALDEAGVAYEWVEEDEFRFVEIDWDDEAAVEAYLGFYGEDIEDIEDWDIEDWDVELTAEDIAEFNAETEELVAALEAEGIPVTVETEEDGLLVFDIDSDDEAVWDRAFEIIDEMYGDVVEVDGNSTEG